MKTFLTIILCGLYVVCFGQEKVTLKDGASIIIYPNKTWIYEKEVQQTNIDSSAIIMDLKKPMWDEVWKHPFPYYSQELKTFPKQDVELIGYSNSCFLIKSTTGQLGYVINLAFDDYSKYRKIIEDRAIVKAKSESKDILIKGIGVAKINSAGGVKIFIDWGYFDYSKDIKYITFSVVPYNNVDDVQTCNISGESKVTCRITGPISASDLFYSTRWDNLWYNKTIIWIKLTKVEVQYMDGSSYIYIKELPKIMEKHLH